MSNTTFYWSPSTIQFCPLALQPAYIRAGTWPSDAVLVADAVASTYRATPPSGQKLGADSSGNPTWVSA